MQITSMSKRSCGKKGIQRLTAHHKGMAQAGRITRRPKTIKANAPQPPAAAGRGAPKLAKSAPTFSRARTGAACPTLSKAPKRKFREPPGEAMVSCTRGQRPSTTADSEAPTTRFSHCGTTQWAQTAAHPAAHTRGDDGAFAAGVSVSFGRAAPSSTAAAPKPLEASLVASASLAAPGVARQSTLCGHGCAPVPASTAPYRAPSRRRDRALASESAPAPAPSYAPGAPAASSHSPRLPRTAMPMP
mmetsp:Transcript_103820/g.317968  ORF Transcript_103820/g.317968 Transcript_103820/m.317968 type:complete len:245 (-) Transcript_103820:592-1326(-)